LQLPPLLLLLPLPGELVLAAAEQVALQVLVPALQVLVQVQVRPLVLLPPALLPQALPVRPQA